MSDPKPHQTRLTIVLDNNLPETKYLLEAARQAQTQNATKGRELLLLGIRNAMGKK